MQRVALGDSANMQAETKVSAEQASKRVMWEPTRPFAGEGRSLQARRATEPGGPTGVKGVGMHGRGKRQQHGKPQRSPV